MTDFTAEIKEVLSELIEDEYAVKIGKRYFGTARLLRDFHTVGIMKPRDMIE